MGGSRSQLAAAARQSRDSRVAHANPDVSLDNVTLLLVTAWQRVKRGEELSAHGFLAMAADMVVSLEKRLHGLQTGDDLLDPRRRLERTRGTLAGVLHQCLFNAPDRGIPLLAKHLTERYGEALGAKQARILQHLAGRPRSTARGHCAGG